MNITKSNVHVMINDRIYTLLQKDEDSKIKFIYNDNIINIVTKDELVENMTHVDYKDQVKIYYYLYEQYIQLAVYEDIIEYKCHEVSFTNIVHDNLQLDNNFSTIKQLNVRHIISDIEFDNNNIGDSNTDSENITLKTDNTSIERHIIDYSNDTELVSSDNTNQSSLGYTLLNSSLNIVRTIFDLTSPNDLDKNNTMVDLVNTSLIWEEVEYNG